MLSCSQRAGLWAVGICLVVGASAGCAHKAPEATSVCSLVPTDPPPSSPWPTRSDARRGDILAFYERSLRTIDGLTSEDVYTFVRQGSLGGFPVLPDDEAARQILQSRFDGADVAVGDSVWTPLDPQGALGRFHMAPYRAAKLPFDALYDAAARSSAALERDPSELDFRLCVVRDLVDAGEVPLTPQDWGIVASLWQSGAPAGHSVSYRHYQQPAYVVLRIQEAQPLIDAVAEAGR